MARPGPSGKPLERDILRAVLEALRYHPMVAEVRRQARERDEAWVRTHLTKPTVEIWKELRGEVVNELDVQGRKSYQSIQKTKTFTPPSKDFDFVFAQLSKNIENACIKARRWASVRAILSLDSGRTIFSECCSASPFWSVPSI